MMKRNRAYFYGCLMGGAIGDALGVPIEFMKYHQIVSQYGDKGVCDLTFPSYQRYALISDDTQLTMFTVEGLLRSATRAKRKNKERTLEGVTLTLFRAYLRWLHTQGLNTAHWNKKDYDGWLIKITRLHAYREPGVTCLTSLGKGVMGTIEKPINDSKGTGALMRVAPIGLIEKEDRAFEIGMRSAAITHGHPCAYLSAGAMAQMIYYIMEGKELEEAIKLGINTLKGYPNSEEVVVSLEQAVVLARKEEKGHEVIEMLGTGFLAHEALAIGIYAALCYPTDYKKAVLLSINHSGDSDSTGAITGSLLGAYLGESCLPEEWTQGVELNQEIKQLALDLEIFYQDDEAWLQKYPSW